MRKYSDRKRGFFQELVGKLLDTALVYRNPTSKWSCAPHLVPKPGPAKWSFTVDLQPVSRYTYALHFPLPLIEAEFENAVGAEMFCEFDMTHGNWQLRLHVDSQSCKSFVTPDGIFTTTRVLHGNLNANSHLHAGFMSKVTSDVQERLLKWADNLVIVATDVNVLLKFWETS